jgi:DNA-binding MarR family transcriptional regulator
MGKEIELLDELLNRISNSINALEKQTRCYDGEITSTPPEAHLIEVIHNHPDANTSEIAAILGLTKGSISIRTAKLCKKGLIEKYNQEGNKKEIYYRVTPLGQRVYDGHEKYHTEQNRKIYNRFLSFSEKQRKFICDFLKEYADYLEDSYFPKK